MPRDGLFWLCLPCLPELTLLRPLISAVLVLPPVHQLPGSRRWGPLGSTSLAPPRVMESQISRVTVVKQPQLACRFHLTSRKTLAVIYMPLPQIVMWFDA